MSAEGLPDSERLLLSQLLRRLAESHAGARISVGDLLAALGDRALGALLFFFAFPNVLPTLPGTSAVLGAPLVFLAAQLSFGRRPWLPAMISERSISREDFRALIHRIGPWLERAEKLLRPRLSKLTLPPMEYAVGVVCLLMALLLVLPIPLGNMLPALAISLLALGVLERDGCWMLIGLAISAVSAVVVSGVVFALITSALYVLTQLLN